MAICEFGPTFVSAFSGCTRSQLGKRFTVDLAKKLCYEDARLVRFFISGTSTQAWQLSLQRFCEGDTALYEELVFVTACYVDYLNHLLSKEDSAAIMAKHEERLSAMLAGQNSFRYEEYPVPTYDRMGGNDTLICSVLKSFRVKTPCMA